MIKLRSSVQQLVPSLFTTGDDAAASPSAPVTALVALQRLESELNQLLTQLQLELSKAPHSVSVVYKKCVEAICFGS